MRILLLADPDNVHTQRWASSLVSDSITLCIFGLNKVTTGFYNQYPQIRVISCDYISDTTRDGAYKKIWYLRSLKELKILIEKFQPDIVHAHYASSYGLLGSLTNFHPYILSVWGSDVYCFPKVSIFHKLVLKYNLKKADYIFSTGERMALETKKYTDKNIEVIPFGVDAKLFNVMNLNKNKDKFVIGITKTLAPIYGIDVLIEAFSLVAKQKNVELLIIGDGPQRNELNKFVQKLNIADKVFFLGRINNDKLPYYYNLFDVAVYPSRSESFGVVAIEAMSCECPLVVSDTDGFLEVVDSNAGLFIPKNNSKKLAQTIIYLIEHPEICQKMGRAGRLHVLDKYQWKENVKQMIDFYNKILDEKI